ncbi:hypothetical protein STEG23_015884, partial [Scotinomys teguina]
YNLRVAISPLAMFWSEQNDDAVCISNWHEMNQTDDSSSLQIRQHDIMVLKKNLPWQLSEPIFMQANCVYKNNGFGPFASYTRVPLRNQDEQCILHSDGESRTRAGSDSPVPSSKSAQSSSSQENSEYGTSAQAKYEIGPD